MDLTVLAHRTIVFADSPILRTGCGLCLATLALATASYGFPYGVAIEESPIELYIAIALIAGGLWASLLFHIPRAKTMGVTLAVMLGLGLIMRMVMFVSLPVLEDDSYRYLWDGAVTAHGINPYKYAPAELATAEILGGMDPNRPAPDFMRLKTLAEAQPDIHNRINYPYVTTIYPPLAQSAFTIAHWIDPFGLTGWRVVLLLSDLLTVALLLRVLKAFNRPIAWICLYWWNPVVIVQGFGAGHMDLLVLPFVLFALLMAKSGRTGLAGLALAGGAAVKIWPIILFPFLLRPYLRHPIKAISYALLFTGSTVLLLLPQLLSALAPEAGISAYASDWRTHAFVFAVLEDVVMASMDAPGQAARLTVAVIILCLVTVLALRHGENVDDLPHLWAVVVAVILFLSPTGYPWYFIWIAPLLPFLPKMGLIALIGLAPLYWLRFALGDDAALYQWGVVPLAFAVPMALLVFPYLIRRSRDALGYHYPRYE